MWERELGTNTFLARIEPALTTVDEIVEAPFTIRAVGTPAAGQSNWRTFSTAGRIVPIGTRDVPGRDEQRGAYELVAAVGRSVASPLSIVPSHFTLRFDGDEAFSVAVAATTVTVTRTADSKEDAAALVRAALPSVPVAIDGRPVPLREGMSGRASFKVGSVPLVLQRLPHGIRFHR